MLRYHKGQGQEKITSRKAIALEGIPFSRQSISHQRKLFGITEKEVALTSFQYMGNFKLATTMFFFVPYVALRIIGDCAKSTS